MATAIYGLRQYGPVKPDAIMEFDIDPSTSPLYTGDIAIAVSDKGVAQHTATSVYNVGVVVGVSDSTGMPVPYYPYPSIVTAASETGYKALVNTDPDQLYVMHWYHASTALSAVDVWNCCDVVVGTGHLDTGISGTYITASGSGTATVMIMGLAPIKGNAWGSDCEVIVKLHETLYGAATQQNGV
jgi:hypothetical protein